MRAGVFDLTVLFEGRGLSAFGDAAAAWVRLVVHLHRVGSPKNFRRRDRRLRDRRLQQALHRAVGAGRFSIFLIAPKLRQSVPRNSESFSRFSPGEAYGGRMPKFTISTHETDPSVAVTIDKLEFATRRDAIEDAKMALGEIARETLRGRTHAGFIPRFATHPGRHCSARH